MNSDSESILFSATIVFLIMPAFCIWRIITVKIIIKNGVKTSAEIISVFAGKPTYRYETENGYIERDYNWRPAFSCSKNEQVNVIYNRKNPKQFFPDDESPYLAPSLLFAIEFFYFFVFFISLVFGHIF